MMVYWIYRHIVYVVNLTFFKVINQLSSDTSTIPTLNLHFCIPSISNHCNATHWLIDTKTTINPLCADLRRTPRGVLLHLKFGPVGLFRLLMCQLQPADADASHAQEPIEWRYLYHM